MRIIFASKIQNKKMEKVVKKKLQNEMIFLKIS